LPYGDYVVDERRRHDLALAKALLAARLLAQLVASDCSPLRGVIERLRFFVSAEFVVVFFSFLPVLFAVLLATLAEAPAALNTAGPSR